MDIFLLYLWTRLDAVAGFAVVALMIIFFGFVILGIHWAHSDDDFSPKPMAIKLAKIAILPILILLLVQNQKDAAIIAGGWAVKEGATSDGAKQLSSKTFALINGKLDEELAKLKKENDAVSK